MKEQLIITIILLSLCLGLSGCTENNTAQEDNTIPADDTPFEDTNISEDNSTSIDTADNTTTENNTPDNDLPDDTTPEEPDVPEDIEDDAPEEPEPEEPEEVEEPVEPEEPEEPTEPEEPDEPEPEEYDISLTGPIEITDKDANGMNLHRRLLAKFEVTSTFPDTVSIGNYEVYLDGVLISRVTPLNIESGTQTFYVHLYQLEDHISFDEITVIFSCGTHVDESNCDNNSLTEIVNYQ